MANDKTLLRQRRAERKNKEEQNRFDWTRRKMQSSYWIKTKESNGWERKRKTDWARSTKTTKGLTGGEGAKWLDMEGQDTMRRLGTTGVVGVSGRGGVVIRFLCSHHCPIRLVLVYVMPSCRRASCCLFVDLSAYLLFVICLLCLSFS